MKLAFHFISWGRCTVKQRSITHKLTAHTANTGPLSLSLNSTSVDEKPNSRILSVTNIKLNVPSTWQISLFSAYYLPLFIAEEDKAVIQTGGRIGSLLLSLFLLFLTNRTARRPVVLAAGVSLRLRFYRVADKSLARPGRKKATFPAFYGTWRFITRTDHSWRPTQGSDK